jgi:HPt (histidine-containing phosphotransfer) domain-containing protein
MEFDYEKLREAGIDTEAGLGYTGGEDKYASAIWRYYKAYKDNISRILTYLNEEDYENYAITVHALKSNSKMIGATQLFREFEALEGAAKAKNPIRMKASTEKALMEYRTLIEALKAIGEQDEIKAEGEIGAEEARETADKLLEALDDFDDELSLELAKKLHNFPFRLTQRGKLEEATDFIRNFMYDEAVALIKEIYPEIKD